MCRKKKILKQNWTGTLKLRLCGYCARLLTSQCSCQVLSGKFCIDNSTAKFISLVVQIYLAGLAIANSFEKKLRLTAKENHVAWHELDKWGQNDSKTDCRIFVYKWADYVPWLFLRRLRQESQILGSYFQKTHNLKVYANYVQCNLSRCHQTVVFTSEFSPVYHDSSWFSRKRLFALQRSYNSWKGFKIVARQIWLHNSLGSPRTVNELRTILIISASIGTAGKCF